MIVVFANQKGGTGKTTLSIHTAAALALRGQRVLLVDADPQHSALDWQASRRGTSLLPVIGLASDMLHRDIVAHTTHYQHVIIDGAPRIDGIAKSAIIASDMVIIPVSPSPYDVWATSEIVELVKGARIYKPSLKAAFVINRKVGNTAIGRDVREALARYPLPVLPTVISQRIAFAESAASGLTVLETDPTSPAANEINALVDEILEGLNGR